MMSLSIPNLLRVYIKRIQQLKMSIMIGRIILAPSSSSEICKVVVLQWCGKITCYYFAPRYTKPSTYLIRAND